EGLPRVARVSPFWALALASSAFQVSKLFTEPCIDRGSAVVDDPLLLQVQEMFPNFPVEAKSYGDAIVKRCPLSPPHCPVWAGHPRFPGGKAVVGNLLLGHPHFGVRLFQPNQQFFAVHRFHDAALPGMFAAFQTHLVSARSLHWSHPRSRINCNNL